MITAILILAYLAMGAVSVGLMKYIHNRFFTTQEWNHSDSRYAVMFFIEWPGTLPIKTRSPSLSITIPS